MGSRITFVWMGVSKEHYRISLKINTKFNEILVYRFSENLEKIGCYEKVATDSKNSLISMWYFFAPWEK